MSKYQVVLSKNAEKLLDKFSNKLVKPILSAIIGLEDNPRPKSCKKLKSREAYRIRVGAYRIIYEIQDKKLLIDVIHLGHRKDVYKK